MLPARDLVGRLGAVDVGRFVAVRARQRRLLDPRLEPREGGPVVLGNRDFDRGLAASALDDSR